MAHKFKVVICDYEYPSVEEEHRILSALGDVEFVPAQCKTVGELLALTRDADGIINQYSHLTKEIIDQMERCRVIATYGIGFDKIDIEAAGKKGIYVCNVPDYCIDEVADHCFALMSACIRQLKPLHTLVEQERWGYGHLRRPTRRMRGLTVGLLGFGRIPKNLAAKCQAFGMQVIVYDPYVTAEAAAAHGVKKVELDELLLVSDVVSAHVPLTKDTYHMIGREQLARMKHSAYLINAGRGGLIDEHALVAALRENRIAGAGLDTFEHEPLDSDSELRRFDNVILTPHAAWYSVEAGQQLQQSAAQEVCRVLSGGQPKNSVNLRYFPAEN